MLEITAAPEVDEAFFTLVLDHCKIGEDEESAIEDLITTYVDAAIGKVESASGRMLFKRMCRLTVDALGSSIALPASPVISVASVTYLDTAGAQQTLASEDRALVDRFGRARLVPAHGITWPATREFPGSVTVTFDAGYAGADNDPALIPAQLRMAVLQTVADWLRFGGNVATTSLAPLPADARRACQNFRRDWF